MSFASTLWSYIFYVFAPVTRHFRFDHAMFALITHHLHLEHANYATGTRHFCWDHANFAPMACHSRLDLAIFAPLAYHFRFDLTTYALAVVHRFCLYLSIWSCDLRPFDFLASSSLFYFDLVILFTNSQSLSLTCEFFSHELVIFSETLRI